MPQVSNAYVKALNGNLNFAADEEELKEQFTKVTITLYSDNNYYYFLLLLLSLKVLLLLLLFLLTTKRRWFSCLV